MNVRSASVMLLLATLVGCGGGTTSTPGSNPYQAGNPYAAPASPAGGTAPPVAAAADGATPPAAAAASTVGTTPLTAPPPTRLPGSAPPPTTTPMETSPLPAPSTASADEAGDDPGAPASNIVSTHVGGSAAGTGMVTTSEDWKSLVDKGAELPVVAADLKIQIPWMVDTPGADVHALYPPLPSRFVALGVNYSGDQHREVWDLAANKSVGRINGLELQGTRLIALSGDGKYFAAKVPGVAKVGLYDAAGQKVIKAYDLKNECGMVTFAAGQRLLYNDGNSLKIRKPPGFDFEESIELPAWRADDAYSLSPGGRYLAVVDQTGYRSEVWFLDVTTEQSVAGIALRAGGDCRSTAFSLDGSRFAALVAVEGGYYVQVWNLATGRLLDEQPLSGEAFAGIGFHSRHIGPGLAWFPDGRRLLLYGRGIYDLAIGRITSLLPQGSADAVRPVADDRVAIVDGRSLAIAEIPAASEAAPDGAPPLVDADRSGLRQIELAQSPAAWTAQPAPPVGGLYRLTSKPVKIPAGHIYQVETSSLENPRAAVMYSERPIAAAGPAPIDCGAVWIEQFDLKNGAKGEEIKLPFATLLAAISPDGGRAATVGVDGGDRIDVWNLADGSHVAGFHPYEDAEWAGERRVQSVDFVDGDHLLTTGRVSAGDASAGQRRLTLWAIPEARAEYEVTIGDLHPVLSPNLAYVAVAATSRESFELLDARTGAAVGSVPFTAGADPGYVAACGFEANGARFAAASWRMSGGEVVIVDLATGEDQQRFPIPVSGQVLQWAGDAHILLDGRFLVGLASAAVEWTYNLPQGFHLRDHPDGRHWYVTAENLQDKDFLLTAVELPEKEIRGTASTASAPPAFQPGDRIRLDLQLEGGQDADAFRQRMEAHLRDRFARADIRVASTAATTLRIRGRRVSDPPLENAIASLSGIDAVAVQVAPHQIQYQIEIEKEGQPLWRTTLDVPGRTSLRVSSTGARPDLSTVGAEVAREALWEQAHEALLSFEPPKYAFPPGSSAGKGRSSLMPLGASGGR